MPTQKQRREAERRRLERQLQRRREREVRQRRVVLITSIVGTIAVIGIVIGFIVANSGGSSKKKPAAAKSPSPAASSASSSAAPACGEQQFPTQKVSAATGKTVSFDGVKIKGATDLKGKPGVTSTSSKAPAKLEYKDLVVGTGKAAGPTSCVTVQYDGVLYKNGTEFDSSWSRGMLAQFSLSGVVKGFTEGIGGTTGVPPMKIGGRRVMILPASLGYGAQAQGKIPANAPLVFVVDLTAVSSAQPAAGG